MRTAHKTRYISIILKEKLSCKAQQYLIVEAGGVDFHLFGWYNYLIFRDSSAVEQEAVNFKVLGSNPSRGANESYYNLLI